MSGNAKTVKVNFGSNQSSGMLNGFLLIAGIVIFFGLILLILWAVNPNIFKSKKEGKKCEVDDPDPRGIYKYDEDKECVLDSCVSGWEVDGEECVEEEEEEEEEEEDLKDVPALTKVPGKIWHTMTDFGWNDPGPKTLDDGSANPNVVEGASIEECWSKKPSDAVIVGHRNSSYSDAPYQNTCFYYNKPQTGAAQQAISNHMMACADPTKNINDGCWQRVISGDKIWNTTPEMGWNDPGPKTWDDGSANPSVVEGGSIQQCWEKRPTGTAIVGHRQADYTDVPYQNTCFYYTATKTGAPDTIVPTGHNVTCADITKDVQKGCSA